MACRIEKINNKELESLVAQYGATEGLKMFLNGNYNKIKPGVPELFESNPELANAVYEAAGFNKTLKFYEGDNLKIDDKTYTISEKISSKELAKRNGLIISSNIPVYIVNEPLGLRKGGYDTVNNIIILSKNTDKETIHHELIHSVEYNLDKKWIEPLYQKVINTITEDSFGGFVSWNFKKSISEFIADALSKKVFRDALKKEGLLDEVDNVLSVYNQQSMPQQKQQAQQLYSQYLEQGGSQGDIQGFKEFVNKPTFDKELTKKIQNKLQKLYPEIKLNITNNPIWEQGDNIFDQKQALENEVAYRLKSVDILMSDKAKQVFTKGEKAKWDLNKILTELAIPKEQKQLLLDLGITDREQLALELASKYAYSVEINTAKTRDISYDNSYTDEWGNYIDDTRLKELQKERPTQYYSNLTVPGGTNYTENEISTPLITPSIKGHAQFSTNNGIGWFRSDDAAKYVENSKQKALQRAIDNPNYLPFDEDYLSNETTNIKTRRILEIQSDLFQKGRDKEDLISGKEQQDYYNSQYNDNIETFFDADNNEYFKIEDGKKTIISEKEFNTINKIGKSPKNQFLQLLNKDNNWVTFFIKSIIQDSAKKGYEKVLFPKGETAAKIEGHQTIAQELEKVNQKLNWLNEAKIEYVEEEQYIDFDDEGRPIEVNEENVVKKGYKLDYYVKPNQRYGIIYGTKKEAETVLKDNIEKLEQEKANLKSQGIEKLKPIEAFYEIKIGNILEKQFGKDNIKTITDEDGNQWREVTINQARDLSNILLQRDEANRIIGQANIKAATVLIDAINQKIDTLPHEYAHHYIAWFRNTPIVQEAIKKWGSEEALVQSIGEQVVKQKGEAYNWWNKFVKWIMNKFNSLSKLQKEELTQILTDAFLTRQDLRSKQYIEGFKEFVNKDNESKYLVDPNQLSIDFEGANRIKEAEIKLTKARAEWDLFCKVSIKDKATAVSHSNEALYSVYPALKRDYPNLDIKIEKHHVKGYYTITVFNPDIKYFRNREGLDEYGNIIIPKFLTSSKIKDKASDKKNPFGEIVIRNQSLIKILESRLSDAKLNSKQASEIKAKISRLENQIEKIIEVNKLSAILDVGSNQAIELTKRLSSIKDKLNESDNIELDDLRNIVSSLVDIKYYIDIWDDLNEVFDVQIDDDHLIQTSELVGKYDGLKNTYATLLEKALIEYFNKESYGTFSRNEIFGSAVDTSYMTMQLQGIQHSDTELLRIANDIIKKSLFDINSELISKSKSINDMTDKLVKLFPGKELDTFKKFLQYDKNGNWTGNLITENSQAYYDKLKELGKLRKNKKLSYAQWLEAVGKMQHRITKEIIDNNDTTYFTQEEINAQKEMLQIYKRDKIAERESLLSSGELNIPGEDRIDGEELKRRMLDWDEKNNPYLYWENIKKGNFKNLPKKAYRYILEPKAKEEWHDKGYKEVMDNETLKEFYLFIVKTFTDNNKVFPQNYKPNQKNYLPELNKSFAEELSKDRGLSMIKGIPDAMINAITTEVNGNIDFNINIGGKVIKSIPIHMMSDRLDTNEKSIDLRKIMLAHTAMALNYKHKSEILPIIQAIQDRLDDMVETTLNTTNTDYKRTIFGVKQNLGKRLNNTKKHLEHTIDTWIFNDNKDTSFVAKQGMFLTKEEKEIKKQLKDKLDAREITQDEYDEQVNKLGKHLSADEIGDSLIRYTYLKALSFPNVVSPAVNMFFGVLSNLNYAAGGIDFTDKEIIESTGIMMRSISKTLGGKLHSETIEKVYAWMEKMKLLGDINESMYGKEKTIADKLVILQMKAEAINQGSVMIAMLKNKKVKDLHGNEVSLWNAYKIINGELIWDKEKLGEQPVEINDKIIEGNAVNLYRLSNQIKAVVKRIHGDYENPLRIKRNVLGRMLILFKTWLPATLKERFGKLDYDQDLGRDIKGRYVSIFNSRDNSNYDINFHKSLATFTKLILTQNFLTKNIANKSLEQYSQVDAENLKRAAREAQVIIALMIVGLLLKSIDSDDDEEKQALNLLINTLGKTNADLMFFFNPGAMMNVGSNPIPPLKTLTDFLKIVPVTYKTLTGDPRYENGPWKDHLRYEKWAYINIPLLAAPAVKMISLADKQYDYSGVE